MTLKKGQIVIIYRKPMSRSYKEGNARLIAKQFDCMDPPGYKSEMWNVIFPDLGEPIISRRIYTHVQGREVPRDSL